MLNVLNYKYVKIIIIKRNESLIQIYDVRKLHTEQREIIILNEFTAGNSLIYPHVLENFG